MLCQYVINTQICNNTSTSGHVLYRLLSTLSWLIETVVCSGNDSYGCMYVCGNLSYVFILESKFNSRHHLLHIELIPHTAPGAISRLEKHQATIKKTATFTVVSCFLTLRLVLQGFPKPTNNAIVFSAQCRPWDSRVDKNSKNPNKP